MTDNLSPQDRQKTMRAVKGKGTRLERRVFAMLAGMRLRGWKKNVRDILGKPDVVFALARVAIFIDGCFWHGCPYCQKKLPQTNHQYWKRKITRNMKLSKDNNKVLRKDGWTVIRIWEHELNKSADKSKIRTKIRKALGGKR